MKSEGIGALGILGIIFVTLKLCNVIHWSWWWILAPFWGGTLMAMIFFLFIIGIITFSENS